jgi:signal transduction histidine kinase
MSRRFIPITRLSIVFILAMVLSGGILSYFSINNISNLKELIEKRVLEEQRELTARFSVSLNESLEKMATGLKNNMDPVDLMKDTLVQISNDHECIVQAFLLKNSGQFIFPNFYGIPELSATPILSDKFTVTFEEGEKAEFSENDPLRARYYYQSCLSLSTGTSDSATALNALGRISVKSGHPEEATSYYSSLLRDYFHLSDRNGFPYAYYALTHLFNLTEAYNPEEIATLLEFCLGKMESGYIPLNFHSEELLGQVSEWNIENPTKDTGISAQIDRSLSNINLQVHFVNQYRTELSGILRDEGTNVPNTDQMEFGIKNLNSNGNPLFLLFRRESTHTAGFLMDRNRLFNKLINAGLQEDFDMEHLVEFPSGFNSKPVTNDLSYSIQLNPYFPGQTILVSIRDNDLISDLIKRRSWIYGIASMLLLMAMLLGIILTLRDIAREKRLANLRSDFISNVTHELKTPLTSIRMYAESLMMKRVKSYSGQKKYLSVVVNESERLTRMINNILEFSKMEKARQEYHPVETSLSEILESAIGDMLYWLEKSGFKLVKEIDRKINAKVDPEKFYQVYTNLLSNAVKYSGDSRNIFVRLYKNHGSVVTEIEDEGIGIEKEKLEKIFEEFYRIERHESGNIAGTGLGLTVVKEIVETHGGKVMVESEIGKGSKFSVILFQP